MAKGSGMRMKAVIYSLSPFEQKVMSGLWRDLPHKVEKKITDNWLNALCLLGPIVGTVQYAKNFKENEKQEHRY
ncbi:hypothetical protein SUGI_0551190 [Cryptomeria japonica]|uniref:cytochrome b-c1 complex subunit 8-2, mitochondrial n=1 Tax=Cryptomeria japonica TaxID=3369 RepID=UPI002408C0C6|nr:cytochrome b-c1 complex subunit 8-2, mitochondrial [Cryptomeria japonica]GLJ28073.1 hypothetical protein SUGI_0551190 [Cryptomeria japonica]